MFDTIASKRVGGYNRLLAARLALKELDREPIFIVLIDTVRAGDDNALHGMRIEDIDTENITQDELQASTHLRQGHLSRGGPKNLHDTPGLLLSPPRTPRPSTI